ncbi:uncharacterized protein LOC110372160 [Helicoverpa armigera]|uniref:uncharacterized protein LOC110372160 n=1 Tax=Helicoverpa armigera TaxID=29058 RepID=UPI0030827C62
MRVELPVLTRCCMCFPLRYGLLVWGYVRLCIGLLLLTSVTSGFIEVLTSEPKPDENRAVFLSVIGTIVVLTFNDVVLNALFIVGGHTKNVRLLRAYYIYSITLWVLMIVLYTFFTGQTFNFYRKFEEDKMLYLCIAVMDIIIYFGHIVIQLYSILLIRSEIVKLTNNCEFRFVNNAAQLEMQYEIDGVKVICDGGNTTVEDSCKMTQENDTQQ